MALSLKSVIKWKQEDGYDYVYIDEYSGKVQFIRKEELEKWYEDQYAKYCDEVGNHAITFSRFCAQNHPDKLQ